MASSTKKKTTVAKMQRESKVREKRLIKQARKEARKLEASRPPEADGYGEASATPTPED
jgi:hypothetical protein